jgi:flagellar biosynthesis/type III secretory pathway chaperone
MGSGQLKMNPHSTISQGDLSEVIEQHIACTQALTDMLQRERLALIGNDLPALERVSAEKTLTVAQLQQLSSQLEACNDPSSGMSLENRITQAGSALRRRWQELLTLASHCQQANLANGALLDQRQSQVRWTLGQMLGDPGSPRTYGRTGISLQGISRRIRASA